MGGEENKQTEIVDTSRLVRKELYQENQVS
jgi:hypothetical protein